MTIDSVVDLLQFQVHSTNSHDPYLFHRSSTDDQIIYRMIIAVESQVESQALAGA